MSVRCTVVSEDAAGHVIQVSYAGRTHYHAAGRCLDWDGRPYHVAVGTWPHYPTHEAAREAIRTWAPRWKNHARDMARARA